MDLKKPKCKYFLYELTVGFDVDLGTCTNPDLIQNGCSLSSSQGQKCYTKGKGTWGPGNDRKIKATEEIESLNTLL